MDKLITLDQKLFTSIYNATNQILTKKVFKTITKISKPFFIIAYALLLTYIFKYLSKYILLVTIIQPLITIILCKFLRKKIGRKRPYIIFSNMNLPFKEDASFPSNHTASSFIIALMFLYVSLPLGIVMLILATLVSISRIIVGLHFPLDVLSALLISVTIFNCFYFIY